MKQLFGFGRGFYAFINSSKCSLKGVNKKKGACRGKKKDVLKGGKSFGGGSGPVGHGRSARDLTSKTNLRAREVGPEETDKVTRYGRKGGVY